MDNIDTEKGLPRGWIWATLEDICVVQSGVGFPKTYQGETSGDFPFVKVSDITNSVRGNDSLIEHAANYLSKDNAQKLSAKVFSPGSTVFAKIGEAVRLNRRALVKIPVLADNNVMGLLPFEDRVLPKYIFYFMQTIDLYGYSRATTVPSVRKSDVEKIELPLPPFSEQRRIIGKIEELFTQLEAGVAELKHIQANLARYKASVLKAACEGRLVPTEAELARAEGRDYETGEVLLQRILAERKKKWEEEQSAKGKDPSKMKYKEPEPPDTEDLPELPEGWVWASVDELVYVATGATPLRSNPLYWEQGSVAWVTSGSLNDLYIDEADEYITELAIEETNTKLFPDGTLLVAMYGEGRTRGKVSELRIEASTNQACAALLFTEDSFTCKPYLKLFFEKNYGDIRRMASGGVQPNLNLSIIRQTHVPLPPLAEQMRIVTEVDRRLSVIQEMGTAVAANIKRAERLRQTILNRAFEGRLVPQDPEDEPASKMLERIGTQRSFDQRSRS